MPPAVNCDTIQIVTLHKICSHQTSKKTLQSIKNLAFSHQSSCYWHWHNPWWTNLSLYPTSQSSVPRIDYCSDAPVVTSLTKQSQGKTSQQALKSWSLDCLYTIGGKPPPSLSFYIVSGGFRLTPKFFQGKRPHICSTWNHLVRFKIGCGRIIYHRMFQRNG